MPVFHFILRAFGTWHPDHPSGWNQHNDPNRRATSIPLARYRRKIQSQPSSHFPASLHLPFLEMTRDICRQRSWRCHAAAMDQSHIHIVASHPNHAQPVQSGQDLHTNFKRILATTAAKLTATPGKRWFSHGGKPKPVRNRAHLDWLITRYLPNQGGICWTESTGYIHPITPPGIAPP